MAEETEAELMKKMADGDKVPGSLEPISQAKEPVEGSPE